MKKTNTQKQVKKKKYPPLVPICLNCKSKQPFMLSVDMLWTRWSVGHSLTLMLLYCLNLSLKNLAHPYLLLTTVRASNLLSNHLHLVNVYLVVLSLNH